MIVWLASYPRSGNTLARTMLNQCFDIKTYEREPPPFGVTEDYISSMIGHVEMPCEWSRFYERSAASRRTVFVKTHLPPEDEQPAIYVVRNGRSAIVSYFHHFGQFFPNEDRTLLELILGHDYYLEWTSHYRAWDPHKRGRTLVLRYEDLLASPARETERIRQFLGGESQRKEWENPFELLQQDDPQFFRRGRAEWTADPVWTPDIEEIFQAKHSELMRELAYYGQLDPAKDYVRDDSARSSFLTAVFALSARAQHEKTELEKIAGERLKELDLAHAHADQLTRISNERLLDVERVSAMLVTRRQVLGDLYAELDLRAGVIDELSEAVRTLEGVAAERLDLIEELGERCRRADAAIAGLRERCAYLAPFETAAQERLALVDEMQASVAAIEETAAARLSLLEGLTRQISLRDDAIRDLRLSAEARDAAEQIARERLDLIEHLTAEVAARDAAITELWLAARARDAAEHAARERLDLIEHLTAEVAIRDSAIADLRLAAGARDAAEQDARQRLDLIERLTAEVAMRDDAIAALTPAAEAKAESDRVAADRLEAICQLIETNQRRLELIRQMQAAIACFEEVAAAKAASDATAEERLQAMRSLKSTADERQELIGRLVNDLRRSNRFMLRLWKLLGRDQEPWAG